MFATQERIDPSAALQGSLFGFADPAVDATFQNLTRRQLDHGSWVDFAPDWLGGSDDVSAELLSTMSWTNRRVRMYDRILPEPRLSAWWTASSPSPFPLAVIQHAQTLLSARYDREFDSIGCNYYRDGRDSVAWHGDKLPGNPQQAVVAIISVGTRRRFCSDPTAAARRCVSRSEAAIFSLWEARAKSTGSTPFRRYPTAVRVYP